MTELYKPIGIPIVGTGSQPGEQGDENFSFMGSPGAMPTYNPPPLPEPEEMAGLTAGLALLNDILAAIRRYQAGAPAIRIDLSTLDQPNRELIDQILNEGEVSVVCEQDRAVQIQESVLTGIWRVREYNEARQLLSDVVEVADIPSVVREQTFSRADALDTGTEHLPPGVLNAPSLLTELDEQIRQWQPGNKAHVINLSLLPLSQEDLNFLGERLGVGPITILSRGYGNCRIGSTGKANVWWVKFYNSEDLLILNTIEVIDVPEVAKAAPEDLQESAERLQEILAIYDSEVTK
ncbi:MAG: hydrogenase expression/formation C-terminal domain-containing protein [Thiolinea sp.]